MPLQLKNSNATITLQAPIQQLGGGAVDSVNGMTGDVVLDIPNKTSQLQNDSDFATNSALKTEIAGFATKSELEAVEGKIPAHVVEYTKQTLTDEQKKQARENVGAEEMYNGLAKTELFFQLSKDLSKRQFVTYIETGNINQFDETEPDKSDVRYAFRDLAMVMGAVSGMTYNNSEISTQVKQFYAAYSAGLITLPLKCYGNPYDKLRYYFYAVDNTSSKLFYVKVIYENGSGYSYEYNYETGVMQYGTFTAARVQAFSVNALTSPPAAPQFEMRAAPTTDMQIATKKYVDDGLAQKAPAGDYVTNSALSEKGYLTLATLPKYDGGVE